MIEPTSPPMKQPHLAAAASSWLAALPVLRIGFEEKQAALVFVLDVLAPGLHAA